MNKASRYLPIIAALGVLLMLLGVLPSAFAEEGQGVISGKVQNKTAGGGPPAGLTVTLRTFAHQADGGTATTTTDRDGNYRFEKLNTANTYAYQVAVKHQGVDYGSDVLVFADGQTTTAADIDVFETTDKPDAIAIDRAHVILGVDPESQTLSLTEILVVVNPGDRTFLPGDPAKGTLHVAIPAQATNLQLEPNLADASMAVSDGFTYAGPVQPGTSQLMYAYELPYKASSFDLVRSFDYPIQQLSFLMPEGAVRPSSQILAPQESLQLSQQGPKYLHLLGNNVPAAAPVTVRLEGLPTPSPLAMLSRLPGWAWPLGAGVIVVALAAGLVIRRRSTAPADDTASSDDLIDAEYLEDEDLEDEDIVDEFAEDDEAEPVHKRR